MHFKFLINFHLHYPLEWQFVHLPALSRHASYSLHNFQLISGCPPIYIPKQQQEISSQNCLFCTAAPPKKNYSHPISQFNTFNRVYTFCSKVCMRSTGRTHFFLLDLSIVSRASASAHYYKKIQRIWKSFKRTSKVNELN